MSRDKLNRATREISGVNLAYWLTRLCSELRMPPNKWGSVPSAARNRAIRRQRVSQDRQAPIEGLGEAQDCRESASVRFAAATLHRVRAVSAGARVGHARTRSSRMNMAAGIVVSRSSLRAVLIDGPQMLRRRRETWTRLTPSFGASVSSVSPTVVIQAFNTAMGQNVR